MSEPKTCPDCAALPGEYHSRGCDVARCPECGGQALSCSCTYGDDVGDREPLAWDGEWPGTKECEEYDLWVLWDPPNGPGGTGWVKCTKNTPGAVHDLNSLACMKWDKKLRKRVPHD